MIDLCWPVAGAILGLGGGWLIVQLWRGYPVVRWCLHGLRLLQDREVRLARLHTERGERHVERGKRLGRFIDRNFFIK